MTRRAALWLVIAVALALLAHFGPVWIPAAAFGIAYRNDAPELLRQIDEHRALRHARLVALSMIARSQTTASDPVARIHAVRLLGLAVSASCTYKIKDPFLVSQYRNGAMALLDDQTALPSGASAPPRVCDHVAEYVLGRPLTSYPEQISLGVRDAARAAARRELLTER